MSRQLRARIRDQVDDTFIVGYRLSVEEFTEGGPDIEFSTRFALGLQDSALMNYVSFSQGNFNSRAAHLPYTHYPHYPHTSFAHVQA